MATLFDAHANTYDSWYSTPLGAFVDEVETRCAFELFSLPKESRVLDLGCGSGNFTLKLLRAGYQVTGVDLSEEMLKIAREKLSQENLKATLIKGDVYKLPFEDASFDGVFSMAAFEFIEDPEAALRELMRVLKPGGQMMVGTIHLDSQWGRLYTSEAFKDSVFDGIPFKTLEEMAAFFPEELEATRECLFLPPDVPEDRISLEEDQKYRTLGKRGGFICLKWIKS
ncbi:MAG: hypothetical protein AVO33_06475 [delta proteobacterium ML8_F1]|jgi:ubiquinone/menaquinone biosynthesis C-methylase UbiE|nr:MAG: hypothetical protein AVO33_06475 [delta proteobacterium ML8_F1]